MNVSRFFKAGLTAGLVAFVMAFVPSTVLADANPNNNGHHYGQLKHRQQPPPAPNPQPGPTTIGTTRTVYVTVSGPAAAQPARAATSTLPDMPFALPVKDVQSGLTNANRSDGVSWLVLLILPALLAVWLLVFARAALAAARRRRRPVEAA